MKILILNSYEQQGGAARAANRLYEALSGQEIDVKYVSLENRNLNHFNGALQSIFRKLDNLPVKFLKKFPNNIFSNGYLSSLRISEAIKSFNPDIIHIHWINHGFLSLDDLKSTNVPIIVTMHDMWYFTGGCHITEGCVKFRKICENCPQIKFSNFIKLSEYNQNRKNKFYSKLCDRITFIGLSSWLVNEAKSSQLLNHKNIVRLPNPIDTNFFRPVKSDLKITIPNGKKCILFGALNATSDDNKGYFLLKEALRRLDSDLYFFVIFGKCDLNELKSLNLEYISVGLVNSDKYMRELYNLADVCIVPSLQENLSNSIMESLACGTPVVAFDIGGNSDMIVHGYNGYLATPFDIVDLSKGIEMIVNNSDKLFFRNNARESVLKNFSYEVVSNQYFELYKNVLAN